MSKTRIETRIEKDPLGEVKIPLECPYGAQTFRALQNFPISGRTASPLLIQAYLHVKSAAAEANRKAGTLSPAEAKLIQKAIETIQRTPLTQWSRLFPVDIFQAGAGTSQNMNVNEVIANIANRAAGQAYGTNTPIHPNDHVNQSQSTNDTFPAAMRLALLEASKPIIKELDKISRVLSSKAKQWDELPKSARTHLQDAVPMTLGQEFSGYAATVSRCRAWMTHGRETLLELGIGGSAAGTGLNVPRGYTANVIKALRRSTGEDLRASPNAFDAMQSQGPIAYYASMLKLTALELTRISNDLRLLASGPMTGLAEIGLPSVQAGSSIMPGKVNPSILEMANQTFYYIIGIEQSVSLAVQAGQLELNVMMPIMAHLLLEASAIAARTLRTLREKCLRGLTANRAALQHYFESTPQIATALSPHLGYQRTAEIVKEALKRRISILQLVREKKLIPEKDLRRLLNVRALTGR